MKMHTSYWKMRIRPGISEVFFLIARWFSIRQLLFHCLFCFYNCAVGNIHVMKNIAASLRRAQFFSACISLQQGDLEATDGHAYLMWSRGRRRSERGMLGQIFTCCQDVTCRPCHSNDKSWLRALAPHASLDADSLWKGNWKHFL